MKRSIAILMTTMILGIWTPGFAGVVQRTENFDELPGWVGLGNDASPQVFGYSLTNNAGGAASGEMGGANERFPKASYADGSIGTIDLSVDNLSATFNIMIDANGNSGLGWFNAATYASSADIRDGISFGFRFDDLSFYGLAGGGSATGAIVTFSASTPSVVVMTYTAATQLCSWTVDGGTPVTATIDLSSMVVDHFGMVTHGDSGGAGNNLWFDDMDYTIGDDAVVAPTPTPTPVPTPLSNPVGETWVETFNRGSAIAMFNTIDVNTETLVKMTSGPTMSEEGWGGYYPPGASSERRTRLDDGGGTNWVAGDDDSMVLSMTDSNHSAGAYAYTLLRLPIDLTMHSPKIEFDAVRSSLAVTNLKMILKTATDGWIISEDVTKTLGVSYQGALGGAPSYVINLPGDITSWFPISNATDAPMPDLNGDDNGLANDANIALVIGGTPVASPDLSEVGAFGIYLNSSLAGNNEISIDGIRLSGDILTPNAAKTWMLMD